MTEVNLNPKKIVEKRFKTAIKGYNAKEVDAFLDKIIQDYEAYDKIVADLKAENKRLVEQIDSDGGIKEKNYNDTSVQSSPSAAENINESNEMPMPGTTNYDILKRLSNLERHVFGQTAQSTQVSSYSNISDEHSRTNDQLYNDTNN